MDRLRVKKIFYELLLQWESAETIVIEEYSKEEDVDYKDLEKKKKEYISRFEEALNTSQTKHAL